MKTTNKCNQDSLGITQQSLGINLSSIGAIRSLDRIKNLNDIAPFEWNDTPSIGWIYWQDSISPSQNTTIVFVASGFILGIDFQGGIFRLVGYKDWVRLN